MVLIYCITSDDLNCSDFYNLMTDKYKPTAIEKYTYEEKFLYIANVTAEWYIKRVSLRRDIPFECGKTYRWDKFIGWPSDYLFIKKVDYPISYFDFETFC